MSPNVWLLTRMELWKPPNEMAANLIMQLPAQNPPGFASDWGSLSEPSHWSSSVGSSANQGAASGARGGLAIPIRFMVPKFSTARGQIWGRGLRHPICYSLQLVAPGGRLLQMTALTQISQDFKNFKSVNKKLYFCDLHLQQWNINVCLSLILHQLCLLYEINL